ncbi:hypothetical protein PMAYCL1PPCAC_06833, partial [Pristionchus mayeri]
SRQACYALLIAVVTYYIAQVLVHFGFNRRVYNFVPGECSVLTLSEEEIYAPDFVSLSDRLLFPYISASKQAGFFTFKTKNKSAVRLEVADKNLHEFQPEGISVWKSRIFVVNHRTKEDTVEILSLSKDKSYLKHLSTVRSRKFRGLRDIATIDKSRFFATVWNEEENEIKRFVEEYFESPSGAVVFFDGTTTKYVERKIPSPYGIVYDSVLRSLYVASYSSESIIVYSVSESFSLTRKSQIELHSSPALMWQGLDRSLVVSTHPIRYRTLFHRINQTHNFSPSLVLRVQTSFVHSDQPRIDALYSNDGASLSSSSSSIVNGGFLLLSGGSNPILSCKLQPFVSFSLS